MFPQIDFDIDDFLSGQELQNEQEFTLGLVPKFNFRTNSLVIVGGRTIYCNERESIEQWVEMMIRTPANKYKIYDGTDFGNSTLLNLINKNSLPHNYIKSEIITELTERICKHKLIESVDDFSIENNDGTAKISFRINTINESIQKEVTISV